MLNFSFTFIATAEQVISSFWFIHMFQEDNIEEFWMEFTPSPQFENMGSRRQKRSLATLFQGNQQPSVVNDRVGRPRWAWDEHLHGLWYFVPSMLWDCWLGHGKCVQPVTGWVLVCWWVCLVLGVFLSSVYWLFWLGCQYRCKWLTGEDRLIPFPRQAAISVEICNFPNPQCI